MTQQTTSWVEMQQQQYDSLTKDSIITLLKEVRGLLIELDNSVPYYEQTYSILSVAIKSRSVTFKQWKALSAFKRSNIENSRKTF